MPYEFTNRVILLGGCLLLLGCNSADQAQLTKAREEAKAAKAEATAAKAEATAAKAELANNRPNAVVEAERRGQDLEVTDTEGNIFRIKEAFLRYTGPTYVVSGTQYSEDHDAIQVTTGAAQLKIPWQEIHAILLLPYQPAKEPVRVVLKNGEVRQGRLEIASLVGKTEAGQEISFVTGVGYLCKILNRDKPPVDAASRAVAELEVTIAKLQCLGSPANGIWVGWR
jgi:hypothetical protein